MNRTHNARAIVHGAVVKDVTTGQHLMVMSRPTRTNSGSTLRVRPLYRDDEFTVPVTAVEIATDPHAWGRSEYIKAVIKAVLVVFALVGWVIGLQRYDVPLYMVTSGSLSVAYVVNHVTARLFKLHRD